MNEKKDILLPEPTLRRLPWYLAYVNMLQSQGIEYVSSTQISKEINVDASQIAKDLSFLNIKGKTRIGYQVVSLAAELSNFLGFHQEHSALMIGVGSLGAALIQDSGLNQYGLKIVAGFDINEKIIGSEICGVPVYDIAELAVQQKRYKADIGILAVPVEHAQESADLLSESGVKAIWNFTPFRIRVSDDVVIQNTSIYAHLAVMYNRINAKK
ncbi:MAG: redox-sensing transcriptional repressor Rex [Bacteroidetes bacterium]|uniref:Redox-sensing transcriptional repressor Rex n=1 Tax=Candidatus Limisoma faecipullorum TaxID=2840854 RepID=A0A9D9IP23_9BACT|nr:redox-sensing transcriptional repressor Rex [Candidatus Limisoma faecipullorum]